MTAIVGFTVMTILTWKFKTPLWAAYLISFLIMLFMWVGYDLFFGPYRPW